MPTKNTIKNYLEGGRYHIYNRGVDKRKIFLDKQDCAVFLYYLKLYLSPPETFQYTQPLSFRLQHKLLTMNLSQEIELMAFALMPNHFHLQVRQATKDGIQKFMRRVATSYAQYFNKKYERIGTLFESTYKAVMIETDDQNLYLSAYIHRNPMKLQVDELGFKELSSYPYYLKFKHASWIKPNEILSFFTESNIHLSYKTFVETSPDNLLSKLKNLTLEED